jgi:hypothetical protein
MASFSPPGVWGSTSFSTVRFDLRPASRRQGARGWPASMCGGGRTRVTAGSLRTAAASTLRLGATEMELPAVRLGRRRRGVEAADRPSPPPPRTGKAEAAAAPEKRAELDPPPPSSHLRASSEISTRPPPALLPFPCTSTAGALPCFATVRCRSLSAREVRGCWRGGPCSVSLVLHWLSSEEMHIQFDEH